MVEFTHDVGERVHWVEGILRIIHLVPVKTVIQLSLESVQVALHRHNQQHIKNSEHAVQLCHSSRDSMVYTHVLRSFQCTGGVGRLCPGTDPP